MDEALRKYKSNADAIARLPGEVSQGDLFFFRLPKQVPVEWCVIFSHPDNRDLWFVVPGDQCHLIGTRDIEVPDFAEYGPMNLRCGCGLWIHSDDFNFEFRTGRLDMQYVEQVRDRLSQIVDNDLPTVDSIRETDAHPDYVEWIEELSAAVDALESALVTKVNIEADQIVVTLARKKWPEQLRDLFPSPFSTAGIAAASGGLVGVLAGLLDSKDTPSEPPAYHLIENDAPGDLIAIEEGNGASLIYSPKDDERPPATRDISEVDNPKQLDWKQDPSGKYYHSFPLLSWQNDQVEVDITGSGPVTIKRSV
jgi:hypothetical protein